MTLFPLRIHTDTTCGIDVINVGWYRHPPLAFQLLTGLKLRWRVRQKTLSPLTPQHLGVALKASYKGELSCYSEKPSANTKTFRTCAFVIRWITFIKMREATSRFCAGRGLWGLFMCKMKHFSYSSVSQPVVRRPLVVLDVALKRLRERFFFKNVIFFLSL